jgi:hypothetical protein
MTDEQWRRLKETGLREPTIAECSAHAPIGPGFAGWYPQMGGYVGRAVVVPRGGCFEAYVWHDGMFPFGEDSGPYPPAHIHHCMAQQFIDFGEWVASLPGMDDAG